MDSKQWLKELVEDELNPNALTKDNGSTKAKYVVIFALPPWIILTDYLKTNNYDVVFPVQQQIVTPTRHHQHVPIHYVGLYTVGIWCIDKPGITGEKLRWKAWLELKRIFEENPVYHAQPQVIKAVRDKDAKYGETILYYTELLISKVVDNI